MAEQQKGMLGWSIAYILIILSLLFPPFSLLIAVIMVPLLIMYVKLNTKQFLLHYLICVTIVYLLSSLLFAGSVGALLLSISLFFLPPVIQMGNLYKKRAAAQAVVMAGGVTLLGELLLSLIVMQLFGLQPVARMKQYMLELMNAFPPEIIASYPMDKETYVQFMVQLLPAFMIGTALFYAVITHWLARKRLVKLGVAIPAYKPVIEWMLPRSLIWIYLVVLIMEMFVRDMSSIFFTAMINLLPLLIFLFTVQAVAFLFYVAHIKGWGRLLPIAAIVMIVIMPPAAFLLSLLGVLDAAFPIRKRLTRK